MPIVMMLADELRLGDVLYHRVGEHTWVVTITTIQRRSRKAGGWVARSAERVDIYLDEGQIVFADRRSREERLAIVAEIGVDLRALREANS